MNLQRIMLMKKAKPKGFIWLHLYNIIEMTKIIGMENRLVIVRGQEAGGSGCDLYYNFVRQCHWNKTE